MRPGFRVIVSDMEIVNRTPRERRFTATEVARQTFLYGDSNGQLVTSTARLSEISGCSEKTIGEHMPSWLREREEMLLARDCSELGVHVAPETMSKHREQMEFLQCQADTLRREIKLCETLEAKLMRLIDLCEAQDDQIPATEVRMFMAACTSRKSLQSQFLEIQRRINQYNGIDGMNEIALTRHKTLASGRAKLDVAAEKAKLDAPRLPDAQPGSRDGRFITTVQPGCDKPVEHMTDEERYGEL